MDEGYMRLRAALDEAHAGSGVARITVLGAEGGTWNFKTGDHLDHDGVVHFGDFRRRVRAVNPDSIIVGTHGGMLRWCGGHGMADGRRTERFTHDGVAMTVEWTNRR